jgi:tyrosine aminotransferase
VYSKSHLLDILKIAEKFKLPVIADEIYADMVFKGNRISKLYLGFTFHALASLSDKVPILTTGGLAKRWLVPGWRVGWILIHDPLKNLNNVRKGLISLTQLTLGANSLIQAAIPELLSLPESFYSETLEQLQENAMLASEILSNTPGIKIVFPQGAMYLMLQLDLEKLGFKSELDFVESLVSAESVLVLPGSCFRCDGPWVRIVFTVHKSDLKIACERIVEFCGSGKR